MHLRQHMSQSLLHLQKRLHTHVALSLQPKHPKLNRAACGVGSLACSAATQKKKPSQPWATKSQANAASAVMAATPMAEAAVVVAVAVVVTVPSAVSAQKVKVATLKAVTSAMPKALKPVASAQRAANVVTAMWNNAVKVVAAKVAAHAKTATAVDAAKAAMAKPVTPKAKPPSTTTLHQKPKPKHAPKHATNAWPAKSAAKTRKAATSHANLAVNAQSAANAVKVAKAVANAAHAANATRAAVNAPLAWTRMATQKPCRSTMQRIPKAKHRKPTRTVANVVSAAHATATAATAASVAIAHRAKKVLQNTPTKPKLLNMIMQHMTMRQTSKRPKRLVSHANRVNPESNANLVASVKNATSTLIVHLVTHRVKRLHKQHLWLKPQRPLACHAFKASHCHWQKCKPWRKAAVWNGSTPIQTASLPCKPPSQRNPSRCMCHASVHHW